MLWSCAGIPIHLFMRCAMKSETIGVVRGAYRTLLVAIVGLLLVGCDLGMDDPSNRFEQLNIDTKSLIEVLKKITDEASANANLAELDEAAGKVRDTQTAIREAEEAKEKKGKGP